MLVLPYREVWAIDTEFNFRPSATYTFPADPQPDGSIQHPVCLVARELYSGRVVTVFESEFDLEPPFSVGPENLFIAYNATAEWLTFLSLGWPPPERVFDCYIEYRRHICGTLYDTKEEGNKGFLKALGHFRINTPVAADQKKAEQRFVLRGGPWSTSDRQRILAYCDTDVRPLFPLTERLLYANCCGTPLRSDPVGLAQAIHRGRCSMAAARMEHTAISVDNDLLDRVLGDWDTIKTAIIAELDTFGLYPGGHFSNARFVECVTQLGILWPRTESGLPKLDKTTLRDMAIARPELAPIQQLRNQLAEMDLEKLQIGVDGRNRTGCRMFGAKTGRSTPSANRYLFGLAKWVRHFLKPPPGRAVTYLDYRNQEFHIAGVLSGDTELLAMLAASDPYMAFAIMAGLAPAGATKQTHPQIRAVCKVLLLGTNYGMGAETFALNANIPLVQALEIHGRLKHTFARYHQWSSEVMREARAGHWLHTEFGWRQFMDLSDVLTIQNWKMQANGAEMTRLACCLATERGVRVCGSIHDAILIEAPIGEIDAAVATACTAMEEASREVLFGHTVPVDAKVVRWPERYIDPDGLPMWERVLRLAGITENALAEI
jgi:DNA polymerase-1